jgi:hypothetical protein
MRIAGLILVSSYKSFFSDVELCEEYTILAQTYADQLEAVKKLCHMHQQLPVLNKFKQMSGANVRSFLGDVLIGDNDKFLSGHVRQFSEGIVESWTLVHKARPNLNYQRDWEVLEKVKEIQSSNKLDLLGGNEKLEDIFRKNENAPCKVCTNNKAWLSELPKYLDEVIYFKQTFQFSSAEKVFSKGVLSNNINHRIGAIYVLKTLY